MTTTNAAPGGSGRLRIIASLGISQTLAWASSYYLAAIVADPIARELGVGTTTIFGAFSASLLVSALLGPRVGRNIDRFGGREVLAVSNLLFAAGLCLMGFAQGQPAIWLAWMFLGAGMGLGLYDAAFATLGRIYGENARSAITGITLIAGLASTVGWPLTAWGSCGQRERSLPRCLIRISRWIGRCGCWALPWPPAGWWRPRWGRICRACWRLPARRQPARWPRLRWSALDR
jgi:MFS family permease